MMRAQGQATVVGGESYMGQNSRWRNNNNNNGRMSSRYNCKRASTKRGSDALEPVLEHCELAMYDNNSNKNKNSNEAPVAACEAILYCPSASSASPLGQKCKGGGGKGPAAGLRILSKLRDGYVKLMNDVASGADLGGVSSFCGAPGYGAPGATVELYSSVTASARRVKDAPFSPRRSASPSQFRQP